MDMSGDEQGWVEVRKARPAPDQPLNTHTYHKHSNKESKTSSRGWGGDNVRHSTAAHKYGDNNVQGRTKNMKPKAMISKTSQRVPLLARQDHSGSGGRADSPLQAPSATSYSQAKGSTVGKIW